MTCRLSRKPLSPFGAHAAHRAGKFIRVSNGIHDLERPQGDSLAGDLIVVGLMAVLAWFVGAPALHHILFAIFDFISGKNVGF